MKCQYCFEELDPERVAYYKGMKVHPKCFNKLKGESESKAKQTWLDELYTKLKNNKGRRKVSVEKWK